MSNVILIEPDAHLYVPKALRGVLRFDRKRRESWAAQRETSCYPSKNGYGDPLSVMLVLDTLMRMSPKQVIRSGALTKHLNETCRQVFWDSVTVGRILGDLAEAAREYQRQTASPLCFVEARRDWLGNLCVIWDSPEAYTWLGTVRDHIAGKAHEAVNNARAGIEPHPRSYSVWATV